MHALSARAPQVSPRATKDAPDTPRSVCMDDLAVSLALAFCVHPNSYRCFAKRASDRLSCLVSDF